MHFGGILRKRRYICRLVLLLIVIISFSDLLLWLSYQDGRAIKWDFSSQHKLTFQEIGLNKCPACFGINLSICHKLLGGGVTVKSNTPWSEERIKGVSYGLWGAVKQRVVLKTLGTSSELTAFDNEICRGVGKDSNCKISQEAWDSDVLVPKPPLQDAVRKYFDCPSTRFLEKIESVYGQETPGQLSLVETIHLITGLHLNPELLLLQIFRQEEGWPFPRFYGVCGRIMVVEDSGPPISSFLEESWDVRAQIAVNLITLAHQLSSALDDWALYIADPAPGNFGVSDSGKVTLLDLEHLVVVDLSEKLMTNPNLVTAASQIACHSAQVTCAQVEVGIITTMRYAKESWQGHQGDKVFFTTHLLP
ncbi:divergent protein kinase domain 2A isoform X2 [Nematostella vectensis]|uniref:divergent protein kinase domain 2A isoform X2 n=1 Tax=Nematostella vectensis TaxID=45351 RepID=UPI0020773019|nr:divergent protein kinase domain 2A isoform X2 [Nematostella vectensis]